jgi:hypothetical protein
MPAVAAVTTATLPCSLLGISMIGPGNITYSQGYENNINLGSRVLMTSQPCTGTACQVSTVCCFLPVVQ